MVPLLATTCIVTTAVKHFLVQKPGTLAMTHFNLNWIILLGMRPMSVPYQQAQVLDKVQIPLLLFLPLQVI